MIKATSRTKDLLACLLAGSILGAALAPAARAQVDSREGIALQNQIAELRAEVQSLRSQDRRGGRGGSELGGGEQQPPPPVVSNDITATLLDRVSALEAQVRDLRGRVDELSNAQQQQSQDLGKKIDDLNFRLQGSGGGAEPGGVAPGEPPPLSSPRPGPLGTLPAGPRPLPPPSSGPAAPAPRTPELALQQGNAALARHDYPAAETDARDVISGFRTSPRAYDAQLLLARALAGERSYAQAAIAFDDTYNRSRTGLHAPDALLGLANSLSAIKERKASCDTLAKLAAEFPRARPDIRTAARAAGQRDGCH